MAVPGMSLSALLLCGKPGDRGTRLTARQGTAGAIFRPCHVPVIRGLKIQHKSG